MNSDINNEFDNIYTDDISDYSVCEDSVEYKKRNHEMNIAWQFISQTSVSVFITGNAGTGKTTFLKRLRELSPKRMVVLAPTGVAAINANGQTIHSFFQLPLGPYIPGSKISQNRFKMSQRKKDLIRSIDLLVIDEISMVRADLLDEVDETLRQFRDKTRPFGGVQLLLIGDLKQLSPIAKPEEWALLGQYYKTPYFFSSLALQKLKYATVELKHVYRQSDPEFINLLNDVRTGNITPALIQKLNTRYLPSFNPETGEWIRLTTHNHSATTYNQYRLDTLASAPVSFKATVKGDFPEYNYPADPSLTLKVGAQVMFIKNDPSPLHQYYNGKIGVVTSISDQGVVVSCDNGRQEINVTAVVWENMRYTIDSTSKNITTEVIGTFMQLPLRLAWAITVHKSQGLTFDNAILDINAAFAHGQVYVALSRCRSLQGIVLASPLQGYAVITDHIVDEYIVEQLTEAQNEIKELPRYRYDYTMHLLDELFSFSKIGMDMDWLIRVVDEYLSRQHPRLLNSLRDARLSFEKSVCHVSAGFKSQYTGLMQKSSGNTQDPMLAQRINDASVYFLNTLHALMDNILRDAVINIDNKSTAEIYNNALSDLRASLSLKYQLFETFSKSPFSVKSYLDVKAKTQLTDTAQKKPRKQKVEKKPEAKKKKVIGETYNITHELYCDGLTVLQIAAKRNLTLSTIYNHMAKLLSDDKVDINRLIKPERQTAISDTIAGFGESYTAKDVLERLPEGYEYGEIKLMIAYLDKCKANSQP